MKHAVERLHLVSLFLSSVLLLAPGCTNGGHLADAAATTGRPPAPVVVSSVEQRDIPVQIKAIGNVEAYQTVQIRSQVNGQIQKIFFKEGEDVREGQQLFQLDKRPFQADLEKAIGQMKHDQAQAENSRIQAERYSGLEKAWHRLPRTGWPAECPGKGRCVRGRRRQSRRRRRPRATAVHRYRCSHQRARGKLDDQSGQSGEGERHAVSGAVEPGHSDLCHLFCAGVESGSGATALFLWSSSKFWLIPRDNRTVRQRAG